MARWYFVRALSRSSPLERGYDRLIDALQLTSLRERLLVERTELLWNVGRVRGRRCELPGDGGGGARANTAAADRPRDHELRFTRHGSLVMDWVEVFAPVVFEPHRRRAWPTSGSLLLDDLPFSACNPRSGRQRIAFRVFSAVGTMS